MAQKKQATGKREVLQLGLRAKGIATLIKAAQFEAATYNRLNLLFKISLETREAYAEFIHAIQTFAETHQAEKLETVGAHLIGLATN